MRGVVGEQGGREGACEHRYTSHTWKHEKESMRLECTSFIYSTKIIASLLRLCTVVGVQ